MRTKAASDDQKDEARQAKIARYLARGPETPAVEDPVREEPFDALEVLFGKPHPNKGRKRPDVAHIWKLREFHGRARVFATPKDLAILAEDYFDWVEKNPLWESKVAHYQGDPVDLDRTKMRAMSIRALCRFIGIPASTWYLYCKREEFLNVTAAIQDVIHTQKFEGAAADLLNANIIARDLGLTERTDITSGGDSITQITRRIIDESRPPDS